MLNNFFTPKSIAIIGASRTPGKLGYDLLNNILSGGYHGKIYPVNPSADAVLGLKSYPGVLSIEDSVDLAIIIIPAALVPKALEECGAKKIDSAIVISAGFKETGEAGKSLEKEMLDIARKHKIRVIGPNCLGLTNTFFNLNATFTKNLPPKGNIAFVSQSGALISTILSASSTYNLGFSKIISIGNKADLDEVDFLEYLENDPETQVIMMYLESLSRGREFLAAARRITAKKPIVVLKAGISERAAKSVMSHTGALAGKDEIMTAAFSAANILRVKNLYKFIFLAKSFSVGKLPQNNRIAVVTNAGGMGVLASDRISLTGLALAELGEESKSRLKASLPPAASVADPFDLIGDAKADRYRAALENILNDENIDGVIVILTPQTMTEKEATAHLVADFSKNTAKPIIAVFSGGAEMDEAKRILAGANIINFDTPEVAVEMMDILWEYKRKITELKEEKLTRAGSPFWATAADKAKTGKIIEKSAVQVLLPDAFKILKNYKVPVSRYEVAGTEKELVNAAKKAGYPVVIKAFSAGILHKAKTGGVAVNIKTPQELKAQYQRSLRQIRRADKRINVAGFVVQPMIEKAIEVIIGARRDPQFGPTVMVGLGGIYTEIFKDVAWGIAPVSYADARGMVLSLKSRSLFSAEDIDNVCGVLVKISALAGDFESIKELDINPLFVGRGKALAVDARIII